MEGPINFLFVGVGGQGILTASDIAAEVGLAAGYDAKKSEVHGFSQRGGVVESHVRWGERVYSPLAERGTVDYLIAMETLEAGRWIEWVRPGGTIFVNRQRIEPMSVSVGGASYPAVDAIESTLRAHTDDVVWIDGLEIAKELGTARLTNTVVLGALSLRLDVDEDVWLSVIERRVPSRYAELNRAAFRAGRRGGW